MEINLKALFFNVETFLSALEISGTNTLKLPLALTKKCSNVLFHLKTATFTL